MRSSVRTALRRVVLRPASAFLVLAAAFGPPGAAAREDPPRPIAHALGEAPSGPAESAAAAPAAAPGLAERLRAARSAALSPSQPVPQPAPESSVTAPRAPLAERIGRDVTYVIRPGVGTPMQILGEALQARVERAAPGEDVDLSTAREFLRANRAVLGLQSPDDELALRQRFVDELGLDHLKFEQRYRGLEVWPNELIVHLDRQGHVYLMDGAYVFTPRIASIAPVVTAENARRRAVEGARPASKVSAAELLVYASWTRPPRLAWRVVVAQAPHQVDAAFVDALNGAVLAKEPLVAQDNVSGSGTGLSGTTLPLNVWNASGSFYLWDTSKPMFHTGCDVTDLTKNCGAIYILDANHTPPSSDPQNSQGLTVTTVASTNPNSWAPPDAVSAAYNFSKVFDYYNQRHGRNSIDGNGGNILAVVRYGIGFYNAFWIDDPGGMFFGDADTFAGSIDVVGHEMTHGVTSHSAHLGHTDQPGAMNEAMSDIFGQLVENFATGSNDWIIGSHLTQQLIQRNLSNPPAITDPGCNCPYPSKMSEYSNYPEIHHNSTIFSHAFYELAVGLPGAIGLHDAERIYYRALTMHLTANAQFLDGRLACIQAAAELFGAGSSQAQRVAQAYDSVEILGAQPAPPPPAAPPVSASDSVLFLAVNGANLTLSRRETALGDPAVGSFLPFNQAAAPEKLAISGDGTLAFYATSTNDACFFQTSGSGSLSCLGLPGTVASVAMSRDTNVFAFVLLSGGQRQNLITVIDLQHNTQATYTLAAPATDAGTVANVLYADTLDFTANRRYLLYDALSVVNVAGGGQIAAWSISALDFVTGEAYTLLPPIPGVDVGNPSVARTSDNFFTFEADNQSTGVAAAFAANLSTGALSSIVTNVPSGLLTPVYTGNDGAIVYSYPDTSAPTGRSLAVEALTGDRLTPSGNPQAYLSDGAFPLIYRRGSYTAPAPNCTANSTTLCLSGGRFQVNATFTTPQGQQGVASAIPLTSDTGYFTFFDPSNVEVVIKVLNACGLNQKVWVFAGGLTNVATVITVFDTLTGVSKTYTNPQNTAFVPVQDTTAFSTCFAGSAIAGSLTADDLRGDSEILKGRISKDILQLAGMRPEAPAAESVLVPGAFPACVQDSQTLCLSNNRFQVRTTWHTSNGQSGSGNAFRLTGDTGYFWFFSASNVEMVVKVLDACGINNRKWVFAGGLTNVEVTTTVTDTHNGQVRQYHNTLGTPFQPLQDTGAFATCP